MRTLRTLSFFIIAVMLTACSITSLQNKDFVSSSESGTEILSVTMNRTACFGSCPVYTVTINADGSVVFNGEYDVKIKGTSRGAITKDDFGYLVRSIERLQFSTWRDQYSSEEDGCKSVWTDNPTVEFVVTTKTKNKKVSYYYGCRGFALASKIDLLSTIIDDVADTQKWIGTKD